MAPLDEQFGIAALDVLCGDTLMLWWIWVAKCNGLILWFKNIIGGWVEPKLFGFSLKSTLCESGLEGMY